MAEGTDVVPDAAVVQRYDALFAAYRALYPSLREVFALFPIAAG